MFTLTIETGNAAFHDPGRGDGPDDDDNMARNAEVARILRKLATAIEQGSDSVRLMDYNGNSVGTATFEEDE
jgi:hypothetical protein